MRIPVFMLCCLLILAGSSCKRKRKGAFTGRILENCAGDPAAGEKVYFYTTRIGGGQGAQIASAVTDANGYFSASFDYRGRRSVQMYVIGEKIRGLSNDETDLGDIYKERATQSVVKVVANNLYAMSNDELSVQFGYPGTYSMHTPFHDTVFPVHVEHSTGLPNPWHSDKAISETHTAGWSYVNGLLPPGSVSIDVPFCNEVPDTIYITIN